MSFFSILETLFLGPLKLVFELIFQLANTFVSHPGISIIFLSLVMNILVLPLYRRADAMQEEARDIENKLRRGVSHIKKSFSGDERMMILQTYYRQNNYKPTDALKGSLSLLLEIPFFMAAYQFLSHLDILKGASLGPIKDLSQPDGLLVIGSFAINVLPILMTLVNVISCVIYLKGFPLKSKIQLYGMALFFLVFLYTSPSGLVFYWTLNNVFSLVKTIFYKIKNPKLVLRYLTAVLGCAFVVFGGFFYKTESWKMKAFLVVLGVVLLLPMFLPIVKSKLKLEKIEKQIKPRRGIFILGGLFLTVLLGLVIPATFISASPQEYVDIAYFHNPLWYIMSSVCMAAGFFLVWMSVFYWLAKPSGKVVFERVIWILCGVTFVNYMFFGTKLGIISSTLQYENGMSFSALEYALNIVAIAAVVAVFYLIIVKWQKAVSVVLLTSVCAFGVMSAVNLVNINKQVKNISVEQEGTVANFTLNKNGKNVVVIMLDRGIGLYVPYIMNENAELKAQFDGFTYYSNVISHGGFTNFGTPGLFGGYEYTPVEMNKRDTESLANKQNEAISVMPVLFAENGYDVTVCDPVYANYQWFGDISIFDEYEGIDAFVTEGMFTEPEIKEQTIVNNHRNFFCFSFMKSMPLFVQPILYDNGSYNQLKGADGGQAYGSQTVVENSSTEAYGLSSLFMSRYNVLTNLPNMTHITDSDQNTFMYMVNNTTHDPVLLQEPSYEPSYYVDNTEYDAAHEDRFTYNGRTLSMFDAYMKSHYQTNVAALKQIGKWFDYLRENGVYDNTKIIIVSDHGRQLFHTDELMHEEENLDLNLYFPLLMVKDFGSEGFTVCDDFMTNADVPTLATQGLIENPVNPFTGKPINSDEKLAHEQLITRSGDWDVVVNNGNTFTASPWISVKDNIWKKSNWKFYNKDVILKEHKLPQ